MNHDTSPMYWASPNVLMISPDVLIMSSNVLNTPQCTHDIPDVPMISADVLMVRCTEHTLYMMLKFVGSWRHEIFFGMEKLNIVYSWGILCVFSDVFLHFYNVLESQYSLLYRQCLLGL